jgi:hypothetical protein
MEANWTCFFFGIAFAETAALIYQYPIALIFFSALIVLGLFSTTIRISFFFFISMKLIVEVFSFKQMWKLWEMVISLWGNIEGIVNN